MNLIEHIQSDIFALFGAIVSILSLVGLLVGAIVNRNTKEKRNGKRNDKRRRSRVGGSLA